MKALQAKLHALLRWSEQHLKTDMVYLFHGSFWLFFAQFTGALLSLLSAIAFANLMSQYDYGIYRYLLATAGLLGIFTLSGLSTTLVRSVALGHEGELVRSFKRSLIWSIPSGAVALLVAFYYWYQGNAEYAVAFIGIAFTSPLLGSFSLYNSYLDGKKQFKRKSIYAIPRNGIPVLITIGLLFITSNPIFLLTIYFIAYTLTTALCFLIIILKDKPNNKIDTEIDKFSWDVSITNTLGNIPPQLDKILIYQFINPVAAAVYTFAILVPLQAREVFRHLSVLSLPKFSEKSVGDLYKGVYDKTLRLFLVLATIIIVYIWMAPYIFKFLFPQYMEAVFYSQIAILSILTVLTTIPGNIIKAHAKSKELYATTVPSALMQIVLLFVLVGTIGIIGAIISDLLGRFYKMISSYYYLYKLAKEEP